MQTPPSQSCCVSTWSGAAGDSMVWNRDFCAYSWGQGRGLMVVLVVVTGSPINVSCWGCFCGFSHRGISAQFAWGKNSTIAVVGAFIRITAASPALKQRKFMGSVVKKVWWGFDQVSRTGEEAKGVVKQSCSLYFQAAIIHSFQRDTLSSIIPRILLT